MPGATDGGAVCERVVSHLDVAPTLLDLLGVPVPADYEGTTLLDPHARRAFAFTDWGDPLLAVRDGAWKYVLDAATGADLLFDLAADPQERADLAAAQPERVASYRAAALAWVSRTRAAVAGW